MWKVTAGRSNAFVGEFLSNGIVAIGFSQAGDYTNTTSRDELIQLYREAYPDRRPKQIQHLASQGWRFINEVKIGDPVMTYDPNDRSYHIGKITGKPEFQPDLIEQLPITRRVRWETRVNRDDLTSRSKYSLGATMTIFKVPAHVVDEIQELASGTPTTPTAPAEIDSPEEAETEDPFVGIAEQAIERIKDRILQLDWDEVQELVAALLRALGYRTIVSPGGSDRGKDIVASRDGFGFEAPRIVVEVKHRRGQIGAPEIRAFLGGRHSEDRGLYVSTGGFSKDAQYEAERATNVTHLMTLDGLARAIVDQYESFDERGKALLPLTKIFFPA
ncbi:MAG: restriction endonuclease [Sphingosinicella sp.]